MVRVSTVLIAVLVVMVETAAGDPIASEEFMERAGDALPLEEPYQYRAELAEGPVHSARRVPNAVPAAGEMAIAADGWRVVVHADSGGIVEFAVNDFVDFLDVSMDVSATVDRVSAFNDATIGDRVILAVTREHLPDMATELTGPKDYAIRVTPDRIVVCGYDERGVMFGLFNLEDRMSLRAGPFLPDDLDVARHSRYRSRMILSWLGWMHWPDAYLKKILHDGFDAIYASVYANPNGVPGPPHYDIIHKQDPDKLHDLIARANRLGIKVYTPILFSNTGTPENEQALREHVRDIVTTFPGIHGYVLLTEGFYFEKLFGAGGHGNTDLREWGKHWTRAVGIVAEECHRINPDIEILPWEYNIDFRPSQVALKRDVTGMLPESTIPLMTWENGTGFDLEGLRGYLRDYSISEAGPAEVTAAQIAEADRRGMDVYCKADSFTSWQFGTMPYVPAPQQWQRRYDALAEYGVDGTMESWSYGYLPNFVADLRVWSCWTNPMPYDELIRATARSLFGAGSEDRVVAAWNHFSEGIRYVPDTGPAMGTNAAVANPLFLEQPPPRMKMMTYSWWDEEKRMHWRHRLNPYWPFAHPIMVFMPDFANRHNRAEQYARSRSGVSRMEPAENLEGVSVVELYNKRVLMAADKFETGLQLYRQAAFDAPDPKRAAAFKEVMIAEQIQRMLRSLHAILEFEDLRFRLMNVEEGDATAPIVDRMEAILKDEIERTEASLVAAERDSRYGFVSAMDYIYTPFVLEQKLQVLHETLEDQLPKYRD